MTPFLAIVKLTMRSAIRSNVFRFLLFLLIVCVILVPNTLKGDGTAFGYIQVMLEYSSGFVAFLLSTSVIWLACSEFCLDTENGQIHMVFVKPVSRLVVWAGKFTGVYLIHLILLVIASVFIYVFVMFQYGRQNFSQKERLKMENEVFVGRRSYLPQLGDMNQQVQQKLLERIEKAKKLGEPLPDVTGVQKRKLLDTIRMEILGNMGEVRQGQVRGWNYAGLPNGYRGPLFVRYKVYSGSLYSKDKKMTTGMWMFRCVQPVYDENAKGPDGKPRVKEVKEIYLQKLPEQILCGVYNEFPVMAEDFIYNGTAAVAFANMHQNKDSEPLHFQVLDSPRLLIPVVSFLSNYIRSVLATAMGIFALCLISCSAAAFLSMPTAVFITLAYTMVGFFSSSLISSIEQTTEGLDVNLLDRIGWMTAKLMMSLLIPVQSFFVSGSLATGELIELSFLLHLLLANILLKGLPLCILGMWLYRRREIALIMKQ